MSRFRSPFIGSVCAVLSLWLSMERPVLAQGDHALAGRQGHSLNLSTADDSTLSANLAYPIEIHADFASRFEDQQITVLLLRGNCQISQGDNSWTASHLVLWELSAADAKHKQLRVYAEGTPQENAVFQSKTERDRKPFFIFDLETTASLSYFGRTPAELPTARNDAVYLRATQHRQEVYGSVKTVQYIDEQMYPGQIGPRIPQISRHVSISPRFLGERLEFKVEQTQGTIPPEYVISVTGGVNIVVDNVPLRIDGTTILTSVDLTADQAVVWTNADRVGDFGNFEIDENTPFQVYLEGNIVVRQGASTVRATHAFYDISQRRGQLLNAEIRTLIPEYDGTLRLRAAEVRQFSETNFHAKDAWVSTSEFGQPKWRLQASDIFLEERPSGRMNPQTGLPDTTLWVTSQNNQLFLEQTPFAPIPYLSAPAEDPRIPIRKFNVGYSGIFGVEVESTWTLEGVLGLSLPQGVDWELETNYYSERGPAIGTRSDYDFEGALLGMPARHRGEAHAIYQYDEGRDNLGLNRRNLAIPSEHRGRVLWRNRTDLSPYTWIQTDVGHIFNNDRNFMEQYFEHEWDNDKDLENTLSIHHQFDNISLSGLVSGRSNDFVNQTDWLPKLDLTVLSEPLFGTPLLWSHHGSIGYANLHQAEPPGDPADPFAPLNYYQDSEGVVSMSRHELTLPFNLGPVNVAPYALGELSHWQENLFGNEMMRLYGSAGVRANVQFSKYMPHVYNPVLGLNGLAHKVVLDMDYSYSLASQPYMKVPQYNAFDDNAQERFAERFIVNEYGGTLPLMYDARNYAIRSGAGRSVTAPYHELVDDQQVLRLGMHHRWQTKVGPHDRPRIIDWMELDLGVSLFPEADRDNFGEDFGLFTGRYAWHVGPRTSVLAGGTFDIFDGGQNVWNVGLLSQRPGRGSYYVGYREVQVGPVDSRLITGSFSYVLSPDLYVATFGTSFDVSEGIDRGQSLTLTRIGEYFLLHLGVGFDRSRDNVGVALSFEPKFGSYGRGSMQLNSLLGIQ